jgi:hypothetical protein
MYGKSFIYESTIRGVTQRALNSEGIVYIGIFIRIPKRNIQFIGEIELGIDHDQLFQDMILDGHTYEYQPDGVLERVEIRERGTGDLLAFWRIPFRKKIENQADKPEAQVDVLHKK